MTEQFPAETPDNDAEIAGVRLPDDVTNLALFFDQEHSSYATSFETTSEPASSKHWFVDVLPKDGQRRFVIEWRSGYGFGLSELTAEDALAGYGAQPDEVYGSLEELKQRVSQLLGHDHDNNQSLSHKQRLA